MECDVSEFMSFVSLLPSVTNVAGTFASPRSQALANNMKG